MNKCSHTLLYFVFTAFNAFRWVLDHVNLRPFHVDCHLASHLHDLAHESYHISQESSVKFSSSCSVSLALVFWGLCCVVEWCRRCYWLKLLITGIVFSFSFRFLDFSGQKGSKVWLLDIARAEYGFLCATSISFPFVFAFVL